MRLAAIFFGAISVCSAQWVMSTVTNPAVRSIAPDVHSVYSDSRFVYVESAGLSLHSFGALQANQYDHPPGPRTLTFRLPRNPKRAVTPMSTPPGIIGVFVTGVPIYNPIGTNSYRDQNIWHQDAVAASSLGSTALPALVGFALDGYPIYGSSGMRSSYRPRAITKRTRLPDGTLLTPGQEGPDVCPDFPIGTFAEDYEYVPGSGDLDEFNGRSVNGSYAYFATATWPYLIGPRYFGEASLDMPVRAAVQHANKVDLWTDRLQIEANRPIRLTLDFHTRFLEKVHEKPVHLIVVSKDLAWFDHIHPEPVPGDALSVTYTFPSAGDYWLYADYTAPGEPPAVARFSLTVGGELRQAAALQNELNVQFSAPLQIEANRDVPLAFTLPFNDLQPWLGAWAHIMIVSADGENFIHAHPLEGTPDAVHSHLAPMPGPSPSTIRTQTGFRSAGVYKLWFQFQRGGELVTVPFMLNVTEGKQPATGLQALPGVIDVKVSDKGFTPARVEVPAGKPARLAFTRVDAQNCASEVVFPALGLRQALPVGKTVMVELPPRADGELHFACGMGMYKGAVVIR
jgi:hypothetical protein